jgi:hypothetical protein
MTSNWLPRLLVLVSCALPASLAAQAPLPDEDMGRSEAEVAPGAAVSKDASKSLEKTTVSRAGVSVFGLQAKKAEYAFWNHRLYEIKLQFRRDEFDALASALRERYGEPLKQEGSTREAAWSALTRTVSLYQSSTATYLSFGDESQKDFRWSDLTKGMIPWLVGAFVALFTLMFLVGHLVGAWCPRCRSFSMVLAGRSVTGFTDQSPNPLESNFRENVAFTSRCRKCGHEKTDRYSGFWGRNRK